MRHVAISFDLGSCRDEAQTLPGTLATCDVIITGRHHGIYLAALARRPFVALSSNTFKVEGLLEGFPELSPVEPDATAIADAEKRAERSPGTYERFFDHLAAQRPLSTFAALGGHLDPGGEHRELQKLAERYRIPVAHREVRPSVPDPAAFGRDVPGRARAFPTAGNWAFVLIATGGLVLSALTCASE